MKHLQLELLRGAALLRGLALETKNAPEGLDELKTSFIGYHAEVKQLADGQRKMQADFKKMDDILAKLETAIARAPGGGGKSRSGAHTAPEIEAEHKAFGQFIKTGSDIEIKALSTDEGPAGGYITGTNMAQAINQKIFDQSPIRRLARVVTIDSGDVWEEPLDFSDLGAEWVGERESRPDTGDSDLGLLTIPLHEVYAKQTVTQKLMDLSFVNIGSWIEGKIADKFGRTEGLAYATGNGVKKPRGFMDYSAASVTTDDTTRPWGKLQYVPSGSAATIADAAGRADGIKSLYWALRAPYRANATWLMASATANGLDAIKDANGQYIWRNGMQAGSPPELLGRPVEFDENMPAQGAGLFPIAFGDIKKAYTVLDWSAIKSIRDPYSDKPNVVFYAYRRTGGDVSNFEAIKLLKCATS
ncbi:phage major capsid protein [Mesorhizobium sp.]|uniref:phage major capsid protein n=1 Tax=Mesorhizobium sp. TaxID=1871066 RepID=UPI0025BBFAAF|nr:phage major capsid protein [Mesorhizobium sp.]